MLESKWGIFMYKVYVYPDGSVFELPPAWMSDDYEIRYTEYCEECDLKIEPIYAEPLGVCDCGTVELPYK